MEPNFWQERWRTGQIGFHLSQPHTSLVKNADRLPRGTIFVPLCGKSQDLLFLAKKGQKVMGVELSSMACRQFFEENSLSFEVVQEGAFSVYHSKDPKVLVTLYCGDFFNLPNEIWEEIECIYDRAALIALPPEMRQRYVARIKEQCRLKRNFVLLLITIEYDQTKMEGPPFSVSISEVETLYAPTWRGMTLSTESDQVRGLGAIERTYVLS